MNMLKPLNLLYRCEDCNRLTAKEIVKGEDGCAVIIFRCFNEMCGNSWEYKTNVTFIGEDK